MTGDSFAQDWPGRGAWGRSSRSEGRGPREDREEREEREERGPRRHDRANWLFARGGRHGGPGPGDFDLEDLIALRRMAGGPFGGPFGRGPRGRGRGRARRGDVRLALLRLLAENPANGYQLMQTIEERSGGRWRPSPGSVYPTLSQLEDEGLIVSVDTEGARRFEITDAGRAHLETRAGEQAPWQPDDEEGENAITELGPLVIQIGKAAWQVASVGDQAQRARAVQLLAETRRALYGILAEDGPDDDPEDSPESAA